MISHHSKGGIFWEGKKFWENDNSEDNDYDDQLTSLPFINHLNVEAGLDLNEVQLGLIVSPSLIFRRVPVIFGPSEGKTWVIQEDGVDNIIINHHESKKKFRSFIQYE